MCLEAVFRAFAFSHCVGVFALMIWPFDRIEVGWSAGKAHKSSEHHSNIHHSNSREKRSLADSMGELHGQVIVKQSACSWYSHEAQSWVNSLSLRGIGQENPRTEMNMKQVQLACIGIYMTLCFALYMHLFCGTSVSINMIINMQVHGGSHMLVRLERSPICTHMMSYYMYICVCMCVCNACI